jgi:hypothetical protein
MVAVRDSMIETQMLIDEGWEYVQALRERDDYLRRPRWVGRVENIRCNGRWCFLAKADSRAHRGGEKQLPTRNHQLDRMG